MWQLGLDWCDFFIKSEKGSKLERFAFNQEYWDHDLFPKLEDFYMNQFLPAAVEAIQAQRG